jgi:hypothetical protein
MNLAIVGILRQMRLIRKAQKFLSPENYCIQNIKNNKWRSIRLDE